MLPSPVPLLDLFQSDTSLLGTGAHYHNFDCQLSSDTFFRVGRKLPVKKNILENIPAGKTEGWVSHSSIFFPIHYFSRTMRFSDPGARGEKVSR